MSECSCVFDEPCFVSSQAEVCTGTYPCPIFFLITERMRIYCYDALFLMVYSDWKKVEEDCRRAIQLDNNSVKVLFYKP